MEQQIAEIRIRGAVQGVGFRPCVWQLAREMDLRGDVRNDGQGVLIRLFPAAAAKVFCRKLSQRLPSLAKIDSLSHKLRPCLHPPGDFTIRPSGQGPVRTQVLPDIATCPACLAELFDPADRRYHYPFGNCTQCGPRYSIIRKLPYDRAHTAMAPFPLCVDCEQEYRDPANRRFHAQPTACGQCGPTLWLAASDGAVLARENAIGAAARILMQGGILAIKATGGFHLACDASDGDAIARLRRFKLRPHKPLAVMARDLSQLSGYAECSAAEADLLHGPAAPIVLLQARPDCPLDALAPGLNRLGVMLPNTPLQHLLMAAVNLPLVMTSGNPGGMPPCLSNEQALRLLGPVVDGLLLHDREILHRVDDSIAQVIGARVQLLRRARGYAPAPLPLPPCMETANGVLALGGDLKCAPCLLHQGQAVLAPYLGDLDNLQIQRQLQHTVSSLTTLLNCQPQRVVCDPHPAYHSHRLAREMALPLVTVQHHHAHLAACLAEHCYPLDSPPVLGLLLDGSGFAGEQSAHPLWGGEILYGDYRHCRRLDGLPAVALPGGEQAVRQPWRNLLAHLESAVPGWTSLPLPALDALQQQPLISLRSILKTGFNAPLASSCGRLFDAVAALLGVAPETQSFEGQAAMQLEALATRASGSVPALPGLEPQQPLALSRLWRGLLEITTSRSPACAALWFHRALAELFVERLKILGRELDCSSVALGGGCIQNRLLQQLLTEGLVQAGFRVMVPMQLPANDGGLALGQAVIGWLRWQETPHD